MLRDHGRRAGERQPSRQGQAHRPSRRSRARPRARSRLLRSKCSKGVPLALAGLSKDDAQSDGECIEVTHERGADEGTRSIRMACFSA